ncbi:MAG: RNA polymerase sigma factor [Scandinavium sp.]|uniref:RNA polymerase sigma factor n=1 Tax=Scandinavium sp. TaxID=2830653 RepID=UPI003F303920
MTIDKEEIRLLLSRIALRDRSAFATLYRQTSGYLYTRIVQIVGDKAIAADLLQEGYTKLWRGDLPWPVDAPWAWLCQLMRNLALDHQRCHARRQESVLPERWGETPFEEPPEADPRLANCLRRLEAGKRNAIVLAWYYGFPHPEIARHLSAPQGTIKSWIRRGLQELKQCLGR